MAFAMGDRVRVHRACRYRSGQAGVIVDPDRGVGGDWTVLVEFRGGITDCFAPDELVADTTESPQGGA